VLLINICQGVDRSKPLVDNRLLGGRVEADALESRLEGDGKGCHVGRLVGRLVDVKDVK
jgi:hypothetical protein